MSDRVIVLREGIQAGTLESSDITQEAVLALAAQGENE
jgi:ribose transport system ATP-binding protein